MHVARPNVSSPASLMPFFIRSLLLSGNRCLYQGREREKLITIQSSLASLLSCFLGGPFHSIVFLPGTYILPGWTTVI